MTKSTFCIFYDGNSSLPHNIELFFNSEKASLFFDTAPQTYSKWELKAVTFEKKGAALNLQHGDNPTQNIVVEDAQFISLLLEAKAKAGNQNWYNALISHGLGIHIAIAISILGLIGLSYVYFIPWVAEKSVAVIPESYDIRLGKLAFEQNMYFTKVDSVKTRALNEFASTLNLNNTKKIQFTVVDSPIINAFALPDGNIVIYTGIINEMKDYDELVGLIGHEVSHVNNRHSMKMICRNLSGYLFVSAILGDANGIMATIGDNVNSLQSLSFSRKFEHEADAEGFKIVVQNNINPKGMSNLFKRLDKSTDFIPEFLSTHPITKERIVFIDEMIKNKPIQPNDNPKLKALFKTLKK